MAPAFALARLEPHGEDLQGLRAPGAAGLKGDLRRISSIPMLFQ